MVGDGEQDIVVVDGGDDLDRVAWRVPGDVGERFPGDPMHGGADRAGELGHAG